VDLLVGLGIHEHQACVFFVEVLHLALVEHRELDLLGEAGKFLSDGTTCVVQTYEGRPVGADLPVSMVLTITETEPGMKGDRVSGALKPATVETGAIVQVPLFLNTGDKIKIDTRNGQYSSKA